MNKKLAGLFGSSRWLIERAAMLNLVQKVENLTPEALQAAEQAAVAYQGTTDPTMVGDVAVIPICGPIFYKPSWYAMYFGGAILSTIRAQFRTALNDPNVKAIVFPYDSPGGIIDMVPEFAKELFAARGAKPMISVADTMIASAAYWLAAQTDQIFVTESSRVGSIGVYSEHEEYSAMMERLGVKVTLISYGEHKVDGNPYEPLSDAARETIQASVNRAGEKFVMASARGRGVTKKVVLDTFGQGKMFDGDEAIALGMADKIGPIDQVLQRVSKGRSTRATVFGREVFVLEDVPADVQAEMDARLDAIEAGGKKADKAVDPDEDGNCPEGYEKRDDMCYPIEDAKAAAGDDDAVTLAAALTD
jgi:capsid assembly protease